MSQSSFFLGRTQEQDQFRRVLEQHTFKSLIQKHLPTFLKLVGRAPKLPDEPYIFLFHGPGGMGKTTLTRRLKNLADNEFQGQYQTVLVDWDRQKDLNVVLQRGHSNIEPQTILDVLHKELKQSLKTYSGELYSAARRKIQQIEADVEKALASEPRNTELKEVTAQYGGKAIAWILQKSTERMINADPTGTVVAIKVGATLLSQARQLVAKSLDKEDVEIFQQPLETLVEELGKDIAKATQRQPTVIFLDTYEVVDRQVCDYALRQVIQQGGNRVIWAISGRSNLAKSGKRGDQYFRGYADDFSEAQIYPRELLQFSFREIQEYFEKKVPDSSLTESEAEAIAEFSLGIPFVVDLAAAMCAKGKPITEIVAPVPREDGGTSERDRVIKETCERFLKHCLDTPETLPDKKLTFALAMLRRSQMGLLGAMVDVQTGLEGRLKALQGRYTFLADDEQRLDEKMANFMQDYLLQDLQRQDFVVQQLNDNAIAWLELHIEERQKNLSDTAEFFEDERLAGWMLDLAHHYGWRGEVALWDYLEPRFIEACQYDRSWARNLLQVAETFRRLLGKVNRKSLEQMFAVLQSTPKTELQTILKEKYGINKNISQSLAAEDCEQVLAILQNEPSTVKLVELFAEKNNYLGRINQHFGLLRNNAEKKLQKLQSEYQQLKTQITTIEKAKGGLIDQKQTITAETQALQADIKRLSAEKQHLAVKVQTLSTHNDELVKANTQLKKDNGELVKTHMQLKQDNKELKNVVDQIRLRLARDTKMLLQYEDSEIRKALIRLFRWTLG